METNTQAAQPVIEMARKLTRSLVSKLTERGVQPADATIALAYALHDAATELTGDPASAVEWLRTAADVMERQLMGVSNA